MRHVLTTVFAALLFATVGVVAASPASALISYNDGHCRSDITGSQANVDGILVDSCVDGDPSGNSLTAEVIYSNPSHLPADFCAHLVNTWDGSWVHDFGCTGWINPNDSFNSYQIGNAWYCSERLLVVVSIGYWGWVNNQYGYYGNVESPKASLYGPS